jgi:7-cyano-7-deazaguanine synthase
MSGGLDSCVTAAIARKDYELALFHGNYGQRTVARELQAFREQASFFRARQTLEAEFPWLGAIGGSSLTDRHRLIPTQEEPFGEFPPTYVPFRNTILLAAAVAWAETLSATVIFIRANVIDNPEYPDCRPEYSTALNQLIDLGTGPQTKILMHTPLIGLDKAGIIRSGLELKAHLEIT